MQHVTLNNNLHMPIVGYGVFQIADEYECRRSVIDAIETGYRLIDTAASYMNEEAVGLGLGLGLGLRDSGIAREELFVTPTSHENSDRLRIEFKPYFVYKRPFYFELLPRCQNSCRVT